MNKKILISLTTFATLALSAAPVFAQTINVNTSVAASTSVRTGVKADIQAKISTNEKSRADSEINRRIIALNKLEVRIQGMKHVADSEKVSMNANIQAQISTLTSLREKIDGDTDATVLKTDVQSITKSYRIFALVIPQGAIIAAADRIDQVADLMVTLGTKFQTRITEAQSKGENVTALQAAYSDYTIKVADAKVQGQATVSTVSGLTPDQGDETAFQANKQVLLAARAKIKVADQDLKTARLDINTIVKGLKALNVNATTSASTTVSAH